MLRHVQQWCNVFNLHKLTLLLHSQDVFQSERRLSGEHCAVAQRRLLLLTT